MKHTSYHESNSIYVNECDDGTIYVDEHSTNSYSQSVYLADGTHINHDITEHIYVSTPVIKSRDDEHLVFGWANISVDAEGNVPLDWQGDVTAPAVLEKAAYNFVLKHRTTGEMHEGEAVGHLVESVMFTKQKQEAMGIPEGIIPEGWWVGFYVPDDEIVAKIKSGEYKMFSIQGKAKRLKV